MRLTKQLQAALISSLKLIGVLLLLWCLGHSLLAGTVLFLGVLYVLYILHPDTYAKYKVNSKAVFITGCDSGFGHELARKLDRLGFIVFAGCLNPTKSGAHSLLNVGSERLHVLKLDVTKDEDVANAVQTVRSKLPRNGLWAVVNNAGIAVSSEVEWTPIADYQKIYDVNVLGVVRVSKAFIPFLRNSKGRIINVASLLGRSALQAFSAYCSSKFAVIGLSDSLRREMRKFDISVHTIEPGLYSTTIASSENILASIDRNWSQTQKSVQLSYGNRYFHSSKRHIASFIEKYSIPRTDEVTDIILDALLEVHPSIRYVPNFWIALSATFVSILPASIVDKLYAYKFDTKQKITSKMI